MAAIFAVTQRTVLVVVVLIVARISFATSMTKYWTQWTKSKWPLAGHWLASCYCREGFAFEKSSHDCTDGKLPMDEQYRGNIWPPYCKAGYIVIRGKCYPKLKYAEACQYDDQCPGDTKCNTGICSYEKKYLGQECYHDSQCKMINDLSYCNSQSRKCECQNDGSPGEDCIIMKDFMQDMKMFMTRKDSGKEDVVQGEASTNFSHKGSLFWDINIGASSISSMILIGLIVLLLIFVKLPIPYRR
ncbi:hypothetical protein HDE_07809 [Halotydeus destructor]|nr:hypothetical protein HDE_07809 [Halotydeus destructor]